MVVAGTADIVVMGDGTEVITGVGGPVLVSASAIQLIIATRLIRILITPMLTRRRAAITIRSPHSLRNQPSLLLLRAPPLQARFKP